MAANKVGLLMLGLALACTSCTQQAPPPASKLYTGPLVYKSVPPELLDLSTAGYVLPATTHRAALIFCTADYEKGGIQYRPVIYRREAGGWSVMDFDVEPFAQGCVWAGVYAAADSGKIWAIAEWEMEGPGTNLEIVYSGDGGQTWQHIASVEKVFWTASLDSFRMNSKGQGRLSTRLDDDITSIACGFYVYHTADWGRTWSAPAFEEDIAPGCTKVPQNEPVSTIMQDLTKEDR